MAEPIRILHIVGAMYPGGMENFIMNLYREIDREQFQFDFVVHLRKENDYKEAIEALGGRVYEIPRLTGHPVKSLISLYRLIRTNHYPIVIRHTANALVAVQLLAARLAGARTVCHSHNETDPGIRIHRLTKPLLRWTANRRLACSRGAGEWMYGGMDYRIIHNAIPIEKFSYSQEKAERINREFGLEGKTVYGHIANFIASKNHSFLLEVFARIRTKDPKAVLICLGDGQLRPEIEEKIRQLGLTNEVILAGSRPDACDFMSRFDLLLFPSLFEGLPLTLIEAQAAGLPQLISSNITEDVILTEGLVYSKSLEEDAESWALEATDLVQRFREGRGSHRECQREAIRQAGYDSRQLAEWYQGYLREILEL